MSSTQIFVTISASFVAFVVVGISISLYLYRRFGYPPFPGIVKSVKLRDDIDTAYQKVEPLLAEGFTVKTRNENLLELAREYAAPPCTMTIRFTRYLGAGNSITVRCHNHRWLSRARSISWSWPLRRKKKTPSPES